MVSIRSGAGAPLLLALSVWSLFGCTGPARLEVADAHPIVLVKETREYRADPVALRDSAAVPERLLTFLDTYRETGGRVLTAKVTGQPAGSAERTIDAIRRIAVRRGIAADRLVAVHVAAGPRQLVLAYDADRAVPPVCAAEQQFAIEDVHNVVAAGFGCATQRNLAAMVANPTDLEVPRTMTAAEAQRLNTILASWRAGEATGAEAEDTSSIQFNVSEVGANR